MKKIVVVGYGNMGAKYSKLIYNNEINNLSLYGILARNKEKQKIIKELMPNIKIYNDDIELFNDYKNYDGIIITTPHKNHIEFIKKAQELKLNILCEKPLGVTSYECKDVLKENNEVNGLILNWRKREAYIKLKEILNNNVMGKIHNILWEIFWYRPLSYHKSASWRSTFEGEGGGLLINQSQHPLAMYIYLFGMPKKVFSNIKYGKYNDIEVDDEVTSLFEHDNDITSTFISSTGDSPGTNKLSINFDFGKIELIDDKKLIIYKNKESIEYVSKNEKNPFYKIPYDIEEINIIKKNDEYIEVLNNFSNALENKEKIDSTFKDGYNTIMLTNAIYLSDFKKRWIDIPINDIEFYNELENIKKYGIK